MRVILFSNTHTHTYIYIYMHVVWFINAFMFLMADEVAGEALRPPKTFPVFKMFVDSAHSQVAPKCF